MHSSVVFSRAARKSVTVVPRVFEIFEAGRCAQKVETAERGADLCPITADVARSGPGAPCCWASAVAGRMAKDATQLLAANSMATDRRARVLRRPAVFEVVCDLAALDILIFSAPWLKLPEVRSRAT